MYSSALFARARPLCTQILPGQGRPPSTILVIRKLEALGYPTRADGEDRSPLRSLVLTQYWSVTHGQTEGLTDLP